MRARSAYVSCMLRHLKSVLAAVLGLAWLSQPGPAAVAGERPIVVELFTSQRCSSCPPADAMLTKLSRRDDVIALSLHVDYWDYLGWRDTFAQRRFTERQTAYRETVVYTPQMVVHGMRDVRATSSQELEAAISAARQPEPPISVAIERQGGMLKCRIEPAAALGSRPGSGVVWIAKYTIEKTVAIGRGENAGRTLSYSNVVSSLNRIGNWAGTAREDVAMPQPERGEGVAIWIQSGQAGPIVAAAKVENPAN